jgi:sec-independent protein translocase protein TatA
MFPNLGIPELAILFVIGLVVFGPKKLPELGKSVGEALVNFKKAFQKTNNNDDSHSQLPE